MVNLAKWPPDDDMPAAPRGGGGVPAGFDSGDGNFKKGRFAPMAILVGLLAVGGFAAFMLIGGKQEADKLTIEQGEEKKKAIFVKPKPEQIPDWRKWAASDASEELRAEALKQLAWAKDPEGVKLAIDSLSVPSEPIQGMAALALAEYGRPLGEPAKDALLAALKKAGPGAKPQIAWALVVLGEARAFDDIMALYRAGLLSKVQRLGGGTAFDPDRMVQLVSLDKLASMAGDESPAVRQLVATILSQNAEPKWTETLIKLVQDTDPEVSRQAAPGLGKIGEPQGARAAGRGAQDGRQGQPQQVPRSAARRRRHRRLGARAELGRHRGRSARLLPEEANLRHDRQAQRSAGRQRLVRVSGEQAAHALPDARGRRARADR